MGALSVLGQLAGGYEQASQIDKQRQFQSEMDRRSQIGDFLKTLATNPNLRQESLPLVAQEYFNLHNTPHNKPYKLDVNKLLAPPQTQSVTPPTTPDTSMTGAALAPGAQAPPAQQNVGPLPTLPPPMPPVTAPPMSNSIATAGVGAAQHTTPGGLFYTPEEAGARQAAQAAPVLAAQTQVPLDVRRQAIQSVMAENPTMNTQQAALLISAMEGRGVPIGAMFKIHPVNVVDPNNPQGPGIPALQNEMTGEIMDQQGNVMPGARAFSPFLLSRNTQSTTTDPVTGLPRTTQTTTTRGSLGPPTKPGQTPTPSPQTPVAPGTPGTVGGRKLPATAYNQIASAAAENERNGTQPKGQLAPLVSAYMQENGMVPHTTQQVSDYQKTFDTARSEDRRYKMMYDILKQVKSNPSPENVGSLDAALLAYHMGMTIGQVKGMRTGKDLVLMHEHARSLPENMRVAVEGWVNGAQLSPEQRENFVQLANESRKTAWQQAVTNAQGMKFTYFPSPTPGLPPLDLWPGTLDRKALTAISKDHNVSYGEARRQAADAGYNIDDYAK